MSDREDVFQCCFFDKQADVVQELTLVVNVKQRIVDVSQSYSYSSEGVCCHTAELLPSDVIQSFSH